MRVLAHVNVHPGKLPLGKLAHLVVLSLPVGTGSHENITESFGVRAMLTHDGYTPPPQESKNDVLRLHQFIHGAVLKPTIRELRDSEKMTVTSEKISLA